LKRVLTISRGREVCSASSVCEGENDTVCGAYSAPLAAEHHPDCRVAGELRLVVHAYGTLQRAQHGGQIMNLDSFRAPRKIQDARAA
jgi:hypothetical protein